MAGGAGPAGDHRGVELAAPQAAVSKLSYTNAAAFRAALKARFVVIAKQDSRYTVNELQWQFAYDQLLSRCFCAEEGERWVLK